MKGMRTRNNSFSYWGVVFFLAMLVLVPAPAQEPIAPTVTKVYENDFTDTYDGDRWPVCELKKGEDGNGFLGMKTWLLKFFHSDLPEHDFVRLRLRIIVGGSVEGTPLVEATDYWTVSVRDGPLLLRTTFQNPGKEKRGVVDGFGQSFPDEYPAALHPAQTGSVGHQAGLVENGIYEFDLVFPHAGESLVVEFQHAYTNYAQEDWYVDGAKLEVISGVTRRTEVELAELWERLAGDDPMAASRAIDGFVLSGKGGVEYVQKRWRGFADEIAPGGIIEKQLAAEIEKHAGDLGNDNFVTRVGAREELKKLGGAAVPHLEKKLQGGNLPAAEKIALKKVLGSIRKSSKVPIEPGYRKRLVESRVARVLRISGERTRGLKVSGSDPSYLGALTDGYAADKVSNFNEAPKYVWFESGGGKEGWVQYDYEQERLFDSAEVFWLESKQNKKSGARLPRSWSLSYLDGKEWKPVAVKGKYPVTLGKWDRVRFAPVKAKSIRLTARSQIDATRMGLLEFRLPAAKAGGGDGGGNP